MKAKKTILLCVILLLGGLTEGLKAQENLNALMKKCENMDTIDMNVIYNKNRETQKTEKIKTDISYSLSVSKSGKVTVSKIERFDYDPKKGEPFLDLGSNSSIEFNTDSKSMFIRNN